MVISALLLGFYWHYSRVDGLVCQWVTILNGSQYIDSVMTYYCFWECHFATTYRLFFVFVA